MVQRLRSTNLRESRARPYKRLECPAVPFSVEVFDSLTVRPLDVCFPATHSSFSL